MKIDIQSAEGHLSPPHVLALCRRANPTGVEAKVNRLSVRVIDGGAYYANLENVEFSEDSMVLRAYEDALSTAKPDAFMVIPAKSIAYVKVYKR